VRHKASGSSGRSFGVFAVLRSSTSSYLLGACTGRSAGFSPLVRGVATGTNCQCITLRTFRYYSPFSSALYSAEPGRGKACRFRLDGQNGLLIFLILMIDDLAVARVFHLLGIVHWIGGVAAVTTIVLPHARRIQERNAAIAVFESFERRFASQARISVAVTGLSGVYMLWRMMAWDRFELLSFWWLHLMVALWLLFALMLFIFEPLGMDRLFRSYALRAHDRAFALATWLHRAALVLATVAIAAGVLGAHGYLL
jgi:uncharacterized membrane protein